MSPPGCGFCELGVVVVVPVGGVVVCVGPVVVVVAPPPPQEEKITATTAIRINPSQRWFFLKEAINLPLCLFRGQPAVRLQLPVSNQRLTVPAPPLS